MKNIRMVVSELNNKKVPALALVLVAVVGAVAGVLAASITVSQVTKQGEAGTYHNNTGVWNVVDTGLFVVNAGGSSNASTAFNLGTGNVALSTLTTAGHWVDIVDFNMGTVQSGTYTATLKFFQNNGSPQGSQIGSTVTSGTWTTTGSSSGTISFSVDLGTGPLTSPITAYITVA